jgi:Kef-type K+ transport system membrane component KefB
MRLTFERSDHGRGGRAEPGVAVAAAPVDARFGVGRRRTLLVYAAMMAVTVLVLLGVRALGTGLEAPTAGHPARAAGGHAPMQLEVLFHVLLALLVITITSHALGALFRHLQQPRVIGEVIAGIALGPSLLGRLAPEVARYVLPSSTAPLLGILAQFGVILFMFLVGLELDTALLGKKTHAALAISHASIIGPLLLGAGLALWLYPRLASRDVPFGVFALFIGVAMSITAFPVLARILKERRIAQTRLGVLAMSCAAVDDVTAWCLLAFLISLAQSRASSGLVTLGLTLAYLAFMLLMVRPVVRRSIRAREARGELGRGAVTLTFVALLASALITEAIGIHAIFGAFVLGALIPHDSQLARRMAEKLEDTVVLLLLPAFFAFTGMRTRIDLLGSLENWLICLGIVAVACTGKIGGSFVAARLSGLGWRDAASLGALMNTRGLVELVVLNIGLDLGIISPVLFAMMVVMAVVTTLSTVPLLELFNRGGMAGSAMASAPRRQ